MEGEAQASLARNLSVSSVTSDILDFEDSLCEDIEFDKAPCEMFGEHDKIGKVIVAKKGEKLLLITNWKICDGVSVAVKFSVSKRLKVEVHSERLRKQKVTKIAEKGPLLPKKLNLEEKSPARFNSGDDLDKSDNSVDLIVVSDFDNPDQVGPAADVLGLVESAAEMGHGETNCVRRGQAKGGKEIGSRKFRSSNEFLTDLENRFEEIVVGGLESMIRSSVAKKLKNNEVLLPAENRSIIHSVNQVYFDQYGSTRPDSKLCQRFAEILKLKFTSTFRVKQVVRTEQGTFDVPRGRGEGGTCDLSKRLSDNFYNRFMRPSITKPSTGVDKPNDPVEG